MNNDAIKSRNQQQIKGSQTGVINGINSSRQRKRWIEDPIQRTG
jgi:hypothetical protein